MDESVCDAVLSFQGDVSHCQSFVLIRLDRLVSQGGTQGKDGLSGLQAIHSAQGGPPSGSVDPNYES